MKRVFGKNMMATSVKPHLTIHNVLVHHKDKIGKENQTGVAYKIARENCDKVCIERQGGSYPLEPKNVNQRLMSYQQEVKQEPTGKDSTSIRHRSAICDHAHQNNHVIERIRLVSFAK